jgi:hypothetical protein
MLAESDRLASTSSQIRPSHGFKMCREAMRGSILQHLMRAAGRGRCDEPMVHLSPCAGIFAAAGDGNRGVARQAFELRRRPVIFC